jgi:O-antigen ligase
MNKIFWIFLGLVVLAPLPFGLVFSLTQAFLACAVMVLVLGYCWVQIREGRGLDVSLMRIWPETLGFFLVLGWGVLQISTITPQSWHHPLWAEAGAVLGADVKSSISLARGDGFESLMRVLTYGAVFFLALQLGRNRKKAELILWSIVLAATGYAVYGIISHFSGQDMVLWVEQTGSSRSLSGTFINRNNFATYLGLGLICAAGLYLENFLKVIDSLGRGKDKALQLMQQAFVRGAPLLACVLILLTALFLTQSRGGVTSTLSALLVLLVFMGLLIRLISRAYQFLVVCLVAAMLGVFFLSGEGWLDRLTATELERETRMLRYEQTWKAVNQAPWTGYGIGSFEQTFFMFADERTTTSYKAHNDWLEMMFELGLPGAFLWFAVLGGLGMRCLLGFFRRRRDHVYPMAGFSACVLVGLHSLADFSLQIPAVAVTFAVLLGVGVAQTWSSLEIDGNE